MVRAWTAVQANSATQSRSEKVERRRYARADVAGMPRESNMRQRRSASEWAWRVAFPPSRGSTARGLNEPQSQATAAETTRRESNPRTSARRQEVLAIRTMYSASSGASVHLTTTPAERATTASACRPLAAATQKTTATRNNSPSLCPCPEISQATRGPSASGTKISADTAGLRLARWRAAIASAVAAAANMTALSAQKDPHNGEPVLSPIQAAPAAMA